MTFEKESDYDLLNEGDKLELSDLYNGIVTGKIILKDISSNATVSLACNLTERQRGILLAGGLLAYSKENQDG